MRLQSWRVMVKGVQVNKWVQSLEHGDNSCVDVASQMKVESNVLASCALRARASNSCLIKADFSFSNWAIRSLFSVTS